nr:immunoglobulin light chain junction region [Macaca mulatta]MPN87716.1 immunoglobulin light chain junction region [Macaca mulatta]MPN89878.1 immunoglobulin light chain junction region [Macaca mulatta]MPN90642.1 immunoglobulin light chain junction region [Macaca mulatta]
CMQGIQFPCTF